jgi:hypothetical protein
MTQWMILAAIAMASAQPEVAPTPLRCSVSTLRSNPEGYQYRLEDVRGFVADAEVIVRALAVDSVTWIGPAGVPHSPNRGNTGVMFRIVETLRGRLPTDSLVLPGVLVPYDDFNPGAVPYRIVRMAGQRGDCVAREYRRGAEYLLLLRQSPVGPTPHWAPLAPLNEQVRGDGDPWLAWVRTELIR